MDHESRKQYIQRISAAAIGPVTRCHKPIVKQIAARTVARSIHGKTSGLTGPPKTIPTGAQSFGSVCAVFRRACDSQNPKYQTENAPTKIRSSASRSGGTRSNQYPDKDRL